MIADGYAFEYTYDLPYRYQQDFKAAENDARAQESGLWSPSTCAAKRDIGPSGPTRKEKHSGKNHHSPDRRGWLSWRGGGGHRGTNGEGGPALQKLRRSTR